MWKGSHTPLLRESRAEWMALCCAESRLQGDHNVDLHRPFEVFLELLDTYKPVPVPSRNAAAFLHTLHCWTKNQQSHCSRAPGHKIKKDTGKCLAVRKRKIFSATEQSLARESSTAKVGLLFNNDLPAQSERMHARCACLHSWHFRRLRQVACPVGQGQPGLQNELQSSLND